MLLSGSIEARKNPLLAADAAAACGRRLVVAGPERDRALVAALRERGADIRGFVSKEELVTLTQEAAALLFPTLHEGFGLPVAEAMACGTPVVATPDPAVREVAGDAVAYAEPDEFAATLERVLADPAAVVAGRARACAPLLLGRRPRGSRPTSTVRCSREGQRRRHLARARRRARALAAGARAAGRRAARDREHPGQPSRGAAGERARARERDAALVRRERESRRRADRARARPDRESRMPFPIRMRSRSCATS